MGNEYYDAVKEKNKQERVLCAAVWYPNLELKHDIIHNRMPVNLSVGAVFCGYRHPHCMYMMSAVTGLRDCETGGSVQGFLTSKNRFVSREEGAKIAYEAGQLVKYQEGMVMYSEDLY